MQVDPNRAFSPSLDQTQPKRAAEAARQFEAIFLQESMRSARESAKLSDEEEASAGSETYREMADKALADALAARGTFGIARTALKGLRVDGPKYPSQGHPA